MNFVDRSILYFLLSEVSIGVSEVDVVEYKIKVLDLVDGIDKDHDFGIFD